MRTIKFKGRVLDSNEWAYGLIEKEFLDGVEHTWIRCAHPKGGFASCEVDPNTIGQFTGLYDCKEREIYEGDLLGSQVSNHYLEVRFIDGMFRLCGLDDATGFGSIPACYLMNKNNLVIEVIGNIYDNKEQTQN